MGKDAVPQFEYDPADEIAGMKFSGLTNMLRSMGFSPNEINNQKALFIEAMIQEGFLEIDENDRLVQSKRAKESEGRMMGMDIYTDESGEYLDSKMLSDEEIEDTVRSSKKN